MNSAITPYKTTTQKRREYSIQLQKCVKTANKTAFKKGKKAARNNFTALPGPFPTRGQLVSRVALTQSYERNPKDMYFR